MILRSLLLAIDANQTKYTKFRQDTEHEQAVHTKSVWVLFFRNVNKLRYDKHLGFKHLIPEYDGLLYS